MRALRVAAKDGDLDSVQKCLDAEGVNAADPEVSVCSCSCAAV